MSETTEVKKLRITLTDRPPVLIVVDDWPVIAKASNFSGQYESQADRKWRIKVRQHRDGRAIVYGAAESQWAGETERRAGELLEPGADIPAAIKRVAADSECEHLAQACIANLPDEELV
jgi:hypothetical protein